ncbi:MAG TPA: ribokinase, partial [Candidatus Nanopelagicales bacterium]|nr:ribokinase [Candidatus Nanopelagicales bacterium]
MHNRVAVVGSLNIDLVVELDRMPGAGETVFGTSLERHPGGKGLNQAVAAARLESEVHMIGAVGDDGSGDWLLDVVVREGIRSEGIATARGTSGTALIEVDTTGQNRIIVIPGANDQVKPAAVAEHLMSLGAVDVVLTQGEVPVDVMVAAAETGRKIGAQVVVNPAPVREYPRELLKNVDVLVPNEHEAHQLTGMPVDNMVDAVEAAHQLQDRGPTCVIITRGEKGAVWSSPDGSGQSAPFKVTAVDTVAAGDAFCGALSAALAR